MNRCRHDISKGFMGILNIHENDNPRTQCRLEEGHEGKHHAWFQPYPGFADEHRWWEA